MAPTLTKRLRGDRAFERIYRRHAAAVYRYALALVRNPADAEDVTQTTFLNAYRAYQRGERPQSAHNWLIAIAHNVCRQRFRELGRRPDEVSLDEDAAVALAAAEHTFRADELRRALGSLRFTQRSALVMRELEGLSYAEIGEVLGVSTSAVETLLFRARRALREQLEGSLTCAEAEHAISRQPDRLGRSANGPLRAHLRECADCASLARRERARRGALRGLGALPWPPSLASFFGGGGVAAKSAAVLAAGAVAGGAGYQAVEHAPWRAADGVAAPVVRAVSPQPAPVPRAQVPCALPRSVAAAPAPTPRPAVARRRGTARARRSRPHGRSRRPSRRRLRRRSGCRRRRRRAGHRRRGSGACRAEAGTDRGCRRSRRADRSRSRRIRPHMPRAGHPSSVPRKPTGTPRRRRRRRPHPPGQSRAAPPEQAHNPEVPPGQAKKDDAATTPPGQEADPGRVRTRRPPRIRRTFHPARRRRKSPRARSPPPGACAREVHRPVRLPRPAAVVGERLLPARRLRPHARPDEADEDRAAVEGVRALEDAGVAFEPTEDRRVEHARAAAVGPVDRPQPRLRVEEAERHPDGAAVVARAELVLVAEAVEQRPRDDRRPELVPLVRAREPLAQPAVADVPAAEPEVEVPRRRLGLQRVAHLAPFVARRHADASGDRGPITSSIVSEMLAPTSRLLALLELLQGSSLTTGREIAERLEIDARTVRRYVAALQQLGIPVEGQRGVGGGYRVRPGYRLPPLMLGDDEAVAVVLGLLGSRRLGLDTGTEAADRALAKIHRVLPAELRRRVEALEEALAFTGAPSAGAPVGAATVLLLADAIRRRRRVRTAYRTFSGEESEREVSPFGIVVHSGRWYLAAYDHGREDLRTFRVDRMSLTAIAAGPALPPPAGFDAVAHVSLSLASVPWRWTVEVLLELPLEAAAARIPPTLAELVDTGAGTLLRMRVGSLDWMATVLAGLGCGFTIREPNELRASVRALGERLASVPAR